MLNGDKCYEENRTWYMGEKAMLGVEVLYKIFTEDLSIRDM